MTRARGPPGPNHAEECPRAHPDQPRSRCSPCGLRVTPCRSRGWLRSGRRPCKRHGRLRRNGQGFRSLQRDVGFSHDPACLNFGSRTGRPTTGRARLLSRFSAATSGRFYDGRLCDSEQDTAKLSCSRCDIEFAKISSQTIVLFRTVTSFRICCFTASQKAPWLGFLYKAPDNSRG